MFSPLLEGLVSRDELLSLSSSVSLLHSSSSVKYSPIVLCILSLFDFLEKDYVLYLLFLFIFLISICVISYFLVFIHLVFHKRYKVLVQSGFYLIFVKELLVGTLRYAPLHRDALLVISCR